MSNVHKLLEASIRIGHFIETAGGGSEEIRAVVVELPPGIFQSAKICLKVFDRDYSSKGIEFAGNEFRLGGILYRAIR